MSNRPKLRNLNLLNWLGRRPSAKVHSRQSSPRQTLAGVALACAMFAALPAAHAGLAAYEGFNYAPGNGALQRQTGGFGWSGGWQTVNNGASSVSTGSLTAGLSASPSGYDSHSTGNFVVSPNNTRSGRFLDTSAGGSFGLKGYLNGSGNIGAAGKTIYISFMQQPNGTTSYYELEFHRGDLGDPGRIGGIGNDSGGNTGVYLRVPAAGQTLIGPGSASVNFYVVRIDFQGGNDTVSVYQNPTSSTEPGTPTLAMPGAGDMSFNGISFGCFNNGRTVAHDEIRVGETWADVTSPGVYSAGLWDGGGADGKWSTAGNWDNDVAPVFAAGLTFAGNAHMASINDLTGVSANSIQFDAAAGAFTLSGNSLGLNGNVSFSGNPASSVTQTINLPLTPSVDITLDTPANGNLALGGNITSGHWLTKIDTGALTLGGTNSFSALSDSGGTMVITGTTAFTGGGAFYLADGDFINNCTATLIIQPGATLTVTGSYSDSGVIGRDSGSGTLIQNGGTFSFNPANAAYLFVGASGSTATHSEYDMHAGLLDMNGKTLGIALGANAAITCSVNQDGGVITNADSVYFDPFFTQGYGIYNLTGGSLYIGADGITNYPGGSYAMNLGGGTIGAAVSWSSSVNMTLTGSNGPVTFNPAGNTIKLSGVLSGPGGMTAASGGVLELSGANTYTGDTTVAAGTILQLDTAGSVPGALRLANGALANLNYNGAFAVGSLYTNGVKVPIGTYNSSSLSDFITGSGTLQVTSGISAGYWTGLGANNNWSTGGNWDNNSVPFFPHALTFAGNARLVNNNDLNGITVSSLTFDPAAGAFQLNGNDITLGGGIGFNGNPPAPVTQTVNLGMTWTSDETINTPTNDNITLNNNIIAGNFNLLKAGAGALTLGGAYDSFAGYSVNGGTNTITGGTTVNGSAGHRIYIGDSSPNNGTLVIQNGASFSVTGNFDDAMVLGRDGGSGRIIQNGGTFTFNPINQTYLFVGATSTVGTQAEYDINGGVLDMGGFTLGIGLGDNGVSYAAYLSQTGGAINNLFELDLGAVRAFGKGVYTLSGGSITIDFGGIASDSGAYAINLGGGTIGASESWSSSLNMNLTNLNGSVTFNPAGNLIKLSGALSGNGGLIVNGSGILELSGAASYTGDTVVNSGSSLQLDATNTSSSVFRLANGAILNLSFSGVHAVVALYTNGVALPYGIYSSANLPDFITGSGSLQVAGLVFSTQPQNQEIYLNKSQTAALITSAVGGPATYQWYLNGNPVAGATGGSLNLSNLQITNAGNYYVVATGAFGSVTSSVASLTLYAINNNVFAYDGFAYPAGAVDGSSQNDGFGWNGPWQHTDGNGVVITAGSLVAGGNAPSGFDYRSTGNSIEVPSNAQTRSGRFFDCSSSSLLYQQGFIDANGNIGADGKTIYLGFLQQPDRTSGFYEMEFHRGNLSDPGRLGGIGNDTGTGNVNLRAPNGVNNRSLGQGTTAVNLYVVRIDYKPGNDDVFVYRNPASGSEPLTATLTASNVADMSLNGLSVAAYNGPDVKHDEIRLGATFEDAIGLAVSNLLPPARTPNGYKVRFAATPGYQYRIQRAPAVTGPWTSVSTNIGPANAYIEFEDTSAPSNHAFYRTVTP